MHEKVVDIGSWDFGMEPVMLLPTLRDGSFGAADHRSFLVKRAGHHLFADLLDRVKLAAGDIPVHLLGVGATEAYGPNRNGDGFNEDTCRKQAHTFEKHARYYRNHQNKDTEKSYGKIALAAYHPRMRRIEVLLIGNGSKEAAARNGGLVLPDSSIERLHRGDDVPFSMACKVAHDVCANCFNKAANRREYCTEDTCINPHDGHRGLGCRDGLTKLSSNGRQQYVENPGCVYFDMSEVVRPAERIAYGGLADYTFAKAASADHVVGGAELAELWAAQNGFSLHWDPDTRISRQMKLASQLAVIESDLEGGRTQSDLAAMLAFAGELQPALDLAPIGQPGTKQAASALSALAGQQICLGLRDFLRLVSGASGEKLAAYTASVAPHLPGVYNRLAADPDLASMLRNNVFAVENEALPSHSLRDWATKAAAAHSLAPAWAQERTQRATLRSYRTGWLESAGQEKLAADVPGEALARQYALYKLAFLDTILAENNEVPLTTRLAILQNYIS